MSPNWELQLVFGDTQYPLFINSVGSFYLNASGGPTTSPINPDDLETIPGLAYDSWLTINREDQVANNIQILPLVTIFDTFENRRSTRIEQLLSFWHIHHNWWV